jgi:hypothetical protein
MSERSERRRQMTAEELIEATFWPRPASALDDAEPAYPRRWRRQHRARVPLQRYWRSWARDCGTAANDFPG